MPHSCRLRNIDEISKRRNAATHAPNINELDDQMARACMLIARAPELKDAMRSECMIVKRYLLQGKALILKVCPTVKRTHMNLAELNGHIMPNCFCISRSDSNSGAKVTVCPCALHRCLFRHVPIKQFVFLLTSPVYCSTINMHLSQLKPSSSSKSDEDQSAASR